MVSCCEVGARNFSSATCEFLGYRAFGLIFYYKSALHTAVCHQRGMLLAGGGLASVSGHQAFVFSKQKSCITLFAANKKKKKTKDPKADYDYLEQSGSKTEKDCLFLHFARSC